MKKLILGLVLALLPQIALAEYILKGPHTTVETDGSQTDGSVNLITKNAGPINFYTNNVLRSSISSTGTTSYVGGLQCGGNLTFTTDASGILTDATNTYVFMNGGLADSVASGASLQLYGVTAAGTPGSAYLSSGAIAASQVNIDGRGDGSPPIRFRTSATVGAALTSQWGIENDGDLVAQSTGNILVGTSSINGDISGVAAGAIHSLSLTSENNAIFQQASADTTGASLYTFKSRAVDGSANTVVSSGDTLLLVRAYGADGAAFGRAAEIAITSDGTPGSADMPGAIDFRTSPDGSTTPASVLKLGQDKAATFTGAITSSATGSLGWGVVDGTDNTACTSQCTSAAVFGFNLAAGATAPVIVGPSDATADICMCAGAS